MTKQSTLYFNQGKLKFSIAHFTIFSETERESLHGHNYSLEVAVTTEIGEPGITFDYRLFEEKLIMLCRQLNWFCLIPKNSPYLIIDEDNPHYKITFNQQSMWLLKSDVVLLPLENITIESLSEWFVEQIKNDHLFVAQYKVKKLIVKVFNGPNHAAESTAIM